MQFAFHLSAGRESNQVRESKRARVRSGAGDEIAAKISSFIHDEQL